MPASVLADFRRQAIDQLITARRINYRQELAVWKPTSHAFPQTTLTYLGNVMNTRAASFYQEDVYKRQGDILGSQRCDCGEQLHKAMEMIEKEGKGVVVYLNQDVYKRQRQNRGKRKLLPFALSLLSASVGWMMKTSAIILKSR